VIRVLTTRVAGGRARSRTLGPETVPLANEHLKSVSRRDVVATPVFVA